MFSFVSHLRIFKLAHFKSFINKYRRLMCLNSSENFTLRNYQTGLIVSAFQIKKYVVFKYYRCIICRVFTCWKKKFSNFLWLGFQGAQKNCFKFFHGQGSHTLRDIFSQFFMVRVFWWSKKNFLGARKP